MQREGDTTMIINKQFKRAFSMVTAIFTIVIMASLTALIMNVTGKTIKETTMQYQKEQATLLARSYTELALLYVSGFDRTLGDCLQTLNGTYGANDEYNIQVEISYLRGQSTDALTSCPASRVQDIPNTTASPLDRTLSIFVDVFVRYKDYDDPSDRNITFYKRTLQRI